MQLKTLNPAIKPAVIAEPTAATPEVMNGSE